MKRAPLKYISDDDLLWCYSTGKANIIRRKSQQPLLRRMMTRKILQTIPTTYLLEWSVWWSSFDIEQTWQNSNLISLYEKAVLAKVVNKPLITALKFVKLRLKYFNFQSSFCSLQLNTLSTVLIYDSVGCNNVFLSRVSLLFITERHLSGFSRTLITVNVTSTTD